MNILDALGAPFGSFWRDLRGVLASPPAFFSGITGMVVMSVATVAFFLFAGTANAQEEDEDLDEDSTPSSEIQSDSESSEASQKPEA